MYATRIVTCVLLVSISTCICRHQLSNNTNFHNSSNVEEEDTKHDVGEEEEEDKANRRTLNVQQNAERVYNALQVSVTNVQTETNNLVVNNYVNNPPSAQLITEIQTQGQAVLSALEEGNSDKQKFVNDLKDVKYVQSKLRKRSTPTNQQWGDRVIQAVGSFSTGIVQLKDAAERGDTAGIFASLASMGGGILAVIPSAPTKFAAAMLQLLSVFIGFAGTQVDPNKDIKEKIEEAVREIRSELVNAFRFERLADLANLEKYYTLLAPKTKRFSASLWDRYHREIDLPDPTVGTEELEELSLYIDYMINNKRGQNAYELILTYMRTASIVDDIFFKMIELMPNSTCEDKSLMDDWKRMWNEHRREVYEYISVLLVPDEKRIFALQTYFPPGNDKESLEIYNYAMSVTYRSSNGETLWVMDEPAVIEDGTYTIESVSKRGFFITLAAHSWKSDWDYHIDFPWNPCRRKRSIETGHLEKRYGGRMGSDCETYYKPSTIGRMVTLNNDANLDEINVRIKNHTGYSTLTFSEDNGAVKFVSESNGAVQLESGEVYSTTTRHPTTWQKEQLRRLRNSGKRYTESIKFKIIPLSKNGNTITVVIGNAQGTKKHFFKQGADIGTISVSHFPVRMRELTHNSESSLDDSFKWILRKQ